VRIDVITIFPEMFTSFDLSIMKRAQEKRLVAIHRHFLRDFTNDTHRTVDDAPYGGGSGMVMKIEPIYKALEFVQEQSPERGRVILLSPQGRVFNQAMARALSTLPRLILICGHYEGIDERVAEHLCDDEISIGDYVLTGGELPAMVVADALVRLIPGVLDAESVSLESFSEARLDYPHYTRPREFMGWSVPEALLSGNHREIKKWRDDEAMRKTRLRRPDLLPEEGER
jgi:tRNA (guanine37-N1)-methyltransferase